MASTGEPMRAIPVLPVTASAQVSPVLPSKPKSAVLKQLCRINGITEQDLVDLYKQYVATKQARHQDELSLDKFGFLYTLRQNPGFVFDGNLKFVYRMMCDEDQQTITLEAFQRFAPALNSGNPPVTKLNVDRVYHALLMDDDIGIMFKEFELWILAYRDQLVNLPLTWPNFHKHLPANPRFLDPAAGKPELLVSRGRTVDIAATMPRLGKLVLASTCLMFESSVFKNRKIFTYNQIQKLELRSSSSLFSKSGIRLTVEDKGNKPALYYWDFPSIGSESADERHRTFVYIRDLMTAHRLIEQEPDKTTACFILKEISNTVRQMRALENVESADPLALSPFHDAPRFSVRQRAEDLRQLASGRTIMDSVALPEEEAFATEERGVPPSKRRQELEQQFLERVRGEIKRQKGIRDSKSPWLYKILPGLQAKEVREELKADIDPEFQVDVVESTEVKAVRKPFSIGEFRYNVQLFRHQLKALFLAAAAYRALKNWDHPVLSAFTALFLINLAYQDLLNYLPAVMILCNLGLLLVLRRNPRLFESDARSGSRISSRSVDDAQGAAGGGGSSGSASGGAASAGDDRLEIAARARSGSVSTTKPAKKPAAAKDDKDREPGGIIGKVRGYYESAVAAKDGLESAQNNLAEINEFFFKIEGLYKWRAEPPSQKFMLYNIVGFLAMLFIPFRYVFPLIVLDVFTSKWQRPGSAMSRLLAQVPLPKNRIEFD